MGALRRWTIRVIEAIRAGDEADIARAIEDASRSRRYLVPLAFSVGGIAMLLGGVRLLFSNWRLTVIQALPAIWIWLAMYDLRAHALHHHDFREYEAPAVAVLVAVIVAVTIGAFFFNAVFGFAIAGGRKAPNPHRDRRSTRPTVADRRNRRGFRARVGAGGDGRAPHRRPALVRDLARRRHRPDDGCLRRGPLAPGRDRTEGVEARPPLRQRRRRNARRRAQHASLHPRPHRPADDRVADPAGAWHPALRCRGDAAGGCDERRPRREDGGKAARED